MIKGDDRNPKYISLFKKDGLVGNREIGDVVT